MEISPSIQALAPRPGPAAAATSAAPDRDRPSIGARWRPDGEEAPPGDPAGGAFGLADLLDIVNPLQHIPVLGNIYRVLSGDTISGPAQVMGAALYGGPIGLISGAVRAIATEINGADPGDALVAQLIWTDAPEAPHDAVLAETAPEADLAPAAAPAPPAAAAAGGPPASPALTGPAALAALAADLRTRGQPVAPPLAAPPPAGGPGARDDTETPERPARDAIVPNRAFAARMREGLDKYRSLAVERGGPGRPAPNLLDRSL